MAGKRITVASYDIDIAGISKKLSELKAALSNTDLGSGLTKKFSSDIKILEKQLSDLEKTMPGSGASTEQIAKYGNKLADVKKKFSGLASGLENFKISDKYIKENITGLTKYIEKLEKAQKELQNLSNLPLPEEYSATTKKGGYYGISGKVASTQKKMASAAKKGDVNAVENAFSVFETDVKEKLATAKAKHGEDSDIYKSLSADLAKMQELKQEYLNFAKIAEPIIKKVVKAQQNLTSETGKAKTKVTGALDDAKKAVGELEDAFDNAEGQVREFGEASEIAAKASESFNKMESSIKRLFSAATAFQIIKRIVRTTIEDFKELDKQFNEIAIVSDYSTKEMWDSFSTVNKMAQEFGVETKNVVEVQNLYYHQGKSMVEVNKLTAQTLTLAKITGMDYANATSNLTAVLNAYNIAAEDAVKVTDSIAAMDTNAAISSEELMVALTKTASIAANAGMSLENTEVFLTKMIETTREAPENLGTALKTIIARFGEVKQEVDGELVELADINRVDTALKSIGISLLDTAGQIRDLDDVFMELSAKWDDLDRNTQRYIATISAGSRQQSRFIAMMEDYDRTLELTEIAQNSAGLSAKQLEKSQESLESATNRLKSSFEELTATWIKAGAFKNIIEGMNNLLGLINEMPPALQAVTVGLSLWLIKTKLITPFLTKQRIITEGLVKGETEETIVKRLQNAATSDYGTTLTGLFPKIKEYINLIRQARGEIEKTTDSQIKNNLASKSGVGTQTDELRKQAANKGDLKGVLKHSTSLGKLKGLKIKGGFKKVVGGLFKDIWSGIKIGFSKLTSAIVGAIGTIGAAVLGALAVIGVSVWGIWKAFFAASVDDTKKVEKLTKAQESYNKSLKDYKNIQKSVTKYKELQVKTFKTSEELEEEQSLIQSIVEEYPHLLDYIDSEGNLHLKNIDILEEEINVKRRLMEENAKAYNNMRLSYSKQGIYADESTMAGAAMGNLKTYYSGMDDKAVSELSKKIDKFGNFSAPSFRRLAKAYASGEKTSFNHKDFSNLFQGQITDAEFRDLVETLKENDGNMYEALKESTDYTDTKIEDIVSVWDKLNQETGGLYSQLLMGIGEEVQSIYAQEAQLFVEKQLADKGLNEEAKKAISDRYVDIKDHVYNDAYDREKAREDEAWKNIGEDILTGMGKGAAFGGTVGGVLGGATLGIIGGVATGGAAALPGAAIGGTVGGVLGGATGGIIGGLEGLIMSTVINWEDLWGDPSKIASEEAEKIAKEFEEKLSEELNEAGASEKINKGLESLGSMTAKELEKAAEKGLSGLSSALNQIYIIEAQKRSKEVTDFIQKIKDLNATLKINGKEKDGLVDTISSTLGGLSYDQIKRVEEIYSTLGNNAGIAFTNALAIAKDKGLKGTDLNNFLNMDLTNLDSVISALAKMGDKIAEDTELMGSLIAAMGGMDAFLFKDATQAAEELQKRIDNLAATLEKISKLEAGEGNLAGIGFVLDERFDKGDIKDNTDIDKFLEEVTWTDDGMKYISEDETATDIALRSSAVQVGIANKTIANIEKGGVTDDEQAEYDSALKTRAMGILAMVETQRQEWKAQQDGIIKGLQKEIELLNKKKDAYKELIDYIKSYDYFQNLTRKQDDFADELDRVNFEIEFSTNSDVIAEDIGKKANILNNQLATNMAGERAANSHAATYRDSIEKNYGEYVSFDAEGNAIVDSNKMIALQNSIAEAKANGSEEQAALLELEKQGIESTVKAYDDARKKANTYAKNSRNNFKELEQLIEGTYKNLASAQERIYEVIKQKEDRHLEDTKKAYDSIKEENDKYLSELQKMVDKERQIRDRGKQQEDVEAKERQLAMMKMDTSGVYKNQILQLEKELQQDYQDLEDAAVDDKIRAMEDQYGAEADRMDKEVEYLENSLEYRREKYSNYQAEVNEILKKGSEEATKWLIENDEKYLQQVEGSQYLMRKEYEKTMADGVAANKAIGEGLITQVEKGLTQCKQAAGGFDSGINTYARTAKIENGKIEQSLGKVSKQYEGLVGDVEKLDEKEGILRDTIGLVTDAVNELDKKSQKHFEKDMNRIKELIERYSDLADVTAGTKGEDGSKKADTLESFSKGVHLTKTGMNKHTSDWDVDYTTETADTWYVVNGEREYYNGKPYILASSLQNGEGRRAYIRADGTDHALQADVTYERNDKINGNYSLYYAKKKFATGGIADFTGPAWLDGTPSKPEAVLNPTQTETFIQFTDALSTIASLPSHTNTSSSISQETGNATYNFTINVDQMASDYDVDKLVERIQDKMVKDSQYRNVTILKKRN